MPINMRPALDAGRKRAAIEEAGAAGQRRRRPLDAALRDYAAFDRLARLRSLGSRWRLRRRIDFGVTSTSSSSSI